MIDPKKLEEWTTEKATALKAEAPPGVCFVVIAWPSDVGMREGAAASLGSNLDLNASAKHLSMLLGGIVEGLESIR